MNFVPRLPFLAFCFLLVFSTPLLAQRTAGPSRSVSAGSGMAPNATPYGPYTPANGFLFANCDGVWSCPTSTPRPMPATPLQDDQACFLTPIAGIHSPTVSVIRLEVPEKARNEYGKACAALNHKKYAEAEEHLQKGINLYPSYSAAWVLLAQAQELEQKTSDAAQSCDRAMKIDSSYAPAFLCLAHLAAGEKKWDQVEELTNRLLQLHPLNASNAWYYNALAYLHLDQLSAAESSALRGIEDNRKDHQPRLHLLLARIYEMKGDHSAEASELQEYLKRDPHSVDGEEVSNKLKAIDKPSDRVAALK